MKQTLNIGVTVDVEGVPALLAKMTQIAEALDKVEGVTVTKVNKDKPLPPRQADDVWGAVVDKIFGVVNDANRKRGPGL